MVVGHARISAQDHDPRLQLDALKARAATCRRRASVDRLATASNGAATTSPTTGTTRARPRWPGAAAPRPRTGEPDAGHGAGRTPGSNASLHPLG